MAMSSTTTSVSAGLPMGVRRGFTASGSHADANPERTPARDELCDAHKVSNRRSWLLIVGVVPVALCLVACSRPFAGYMSDGCDGFRDALTALEQHDRQDLDDAIRRGGFGEPASEESGGSAERRQQIRVLEAGYRALSLHV